MSAPASDPPVTPPNPPNGDQKTDTTPSNPSETPAGAAETAAPTEDVKMEESRPVEDTFEDIPDAVLSVSGSLLYGPTIADGCRV